MKRILDISVSSLLLLLLLPLIMVVAIAVKLDSPGPVIFRCQRIGFRGRRLRVAKFRKMYADAKGPLLSADRDARFTRIGRFLARSKLDELPQLVAVLKGELSLVGPRPEDDEFVNLHRAAYDQVLTVRPGLTGLSQLAFARESEILDRDAPVDHYVSRILPQKVSLDVFYAENRSLAMDLRILWWTVVAIAFRREVSVHRETGKLSRRKSRVRATWSAEPEPAGATAE